MKLAKAYKSYKYSNITVCQEPDREVEDFLTGAKSTTDGRKYFSLQPVDEINKLIDSGKDLEWAETKHSNGKSTYAFQIKKSKKA